MLGRVAVGGASLGQGTNLLSLRSLAFGDRFRFWHGRSGKRYVFSSFSIDDLPTFESAVVIGMKAGSDGVPRAIWIASAENRTDLWELASLLGGTATEVHLHLLAAGEELRLAVMADIGDADSSIRTVEPASRDDAKTRATTAREDCVRRDPFGCADRRCDECASAGI